MILHLSGQLKSDIFERSCGWVLEHFDELYDPYSGITNNLSESYNAVLKEGIAGGYACFRFSFPSDV